MLLSAVSVLVVAQSISEIPEGLMNNPVHMHGTFISIRAFLIYCLTLGSVGRDSSFVIATGYGLDGSGIESRWWRDFPYLSRPALGPTQPPVQWVPGLSRE